MDLNRFEGETSGSPGHLSDGNVKIFTLLISWSLRALRRKTRYEMVTPAGVEGGSRVAAEDPARYRGVTRRGIGSRAGVAAAPDSVTEQPRRGHRVRT